MIIGLTGGIGSGKSQASRRFIQHGITVVDADQVARQVVVPGSPALAAIQAHFGARVIDEQGALNRRLLRDLIFQSPAEKHWLESLLHPLINQEIRRQLANSDSPYTILESPLLLETQQHQLVDRVLVIDASEHLQIKRASQRDNTSEEQIKAIMQTQLSRQERCARAQDIIQNHGDLEELEVQVDKLHYRYLELIQSHPVSNG